jgi:hypothetical protein
MNSDEQETRRLILNIDLGEEADEEELLEATLQLRAELMDLDVEKAEFLKEGELPEGAKSAEVVTLGSLAVVVLPIVVPKLLEFLQSWTLRGEDRKVTLKTQSGDRSIELEYMPSAMPADELQRLIQTMTAALGALPDSS